MDGAPDGAHLAGHDARDQVAEDRVARAAGRQREVLPGRGGRSPAPAEFYWLAEPGPGRAGGS